MRLMTSGGGCVVMVVWSTAPWWMRSTSFAAAVSAVAAEAAEADATSEDVNSHPALENENVVLPCAGRVCCDWSPFLALPVVLVLTSPTADRSSTSGLIPLNHCMTLRALMVDAGLSLGECASLPPMVGKMAIWRCAYAVDGAVPAVVEVVVVAMMGVVEREALAGVSPVGVFPLRFLIVRLNGSRR